MGESVVKNFYKYQELKNLEEAIIRNPADILKELLSKGKPISELERDVIIAAVNRLKSGENSEKFGFSGKIEKFFTSLRRGTVEITSLSLVLLMFIAWAISSIGTSFKLNYAIHHVKESTAFVDGYEEKFSGVEKEIGDMKKDQKYLKDITKPLIPKKHDKTEEAEDSEE